MRIKFCNINIGKVKSEKGFTLLELIFVTVIVGILSSTIIMPIISGLRQGIRPEIMATAMYTAEKELEELKVGGYSNIAGYCNSVVPSSIELKGVTYNESSTREYVSYSGGALVTSVTPTAFIRVIETVSNSENSEDVSMWTILPKDFYDQVANPP